MSIFIALSTEFDFDFFEKRFEQDKGPRHTISRLSEELDAKVFQPKGIASFVFKTLSKLVGSDRQWALAKNISQHVKTNDIIYCAGEDIGFVLAIYLKFFRKRKISLIVYFLDPTKIRYKYLFKFLNLSSIITECFVTDDNKKSYLTSYYGYENNRVLVLPEQTDEKFFTPGNKTALKGDKFLIASCGMEQRDYKTLAQSVAGIDLEIKICGHSPNLTNKTSYTVPDKIPNNIEFRYFEFSELRDLYRSSDVVVICVLENPYSAGMTVLMEACACKKPVILTDNIGLGREFIQKGLVIGVQPGNVGELRKQILSIMEQPQEYEEMANRAYEYFLNNHTSLQLVDQMKQRLLNIQ